MARLSIRVDLDGDLRLGPGKILLLERIDALGSIAASGRSMAMSYRRAWALVAEINASFCEPLVASQPGGKQGGGAVLTPRGREVVEAYRAIERAAQSASAAQLALLQASARKA